MFSGPFGLLARVEALRDLVEGWRARKDSVERRDTASSDQRDAASRIESAEAAIKDCAVSIRLVLVEVEVSRGASA